MDTGWIEYPGTASDATVMARKRLIFNADSATEITGIRSSVTANGFKYDIHVELTARPNDFGKWDLQCTENIGAGWPSDTTAYQRTYEQRGKLVTVTEVYFNDPLSAANWLNLNYSSGVIRATLKHSDDGRRAIAERHIIAP
jgi:hypothetical protein